MSKIVFFNIPAHGHTNPTLGVVKELISRGHHVWYYSYNEFKDKIMTLSEWAGTDEDVSDPYGGDLDEYRNCRDQIKGLIEKGWLMYD